MQISRFGVILAVFVSLAAARLAGADGQEPAGELRAQLAAIAAAQGQAEESQRFSELVDWLYEYTVLTSPESATWMGDPRGAGRWSDLSQAAITQRKADERAMLATLQGIDRQQLEPKRHLDYDLLLGRLNDRVSAQQFPDELLPVNQMSGVQRDIAQMLSMMPARSVADYQAMLGRLEGAPELIDQTIALMRAGLASGVTQPQIVLRDVPDQVRNQLVDDPNDSPILKPFQAFPDSIDPLQQQALRQRAGELFSAGIAPAYERLLTFLEQEYLPASRQGIALEELPNGKAWYQHNVRVMTTTDTTPAAIHELGLSEVKRIRAEMDAIIEGLAFAGSFEDFLHFLRTDPQFYHRTAEGLLQEYRDISKRADPELVKLFGHLPRTPYGVVEIPAYAAKSTTTAYYMPGSVKAGRAGFFFANTYALDTRPRWEMEALTLHEAVPGHHLQVAIQDELQDVPWFRTVPDYTGFVEGWGLYAESLGTEMGFYQDPYSKFGQLTYEMWRAIRLVVDTGMHHKGWTRQQAIDYFMANAGKQEHDVTVEIDRYIVWPGQALAYKIGELKIKELRAWATETLGEQFDVRGFHDVVLGSGAVPLHLLESNVRAWVAEQSAP
jgi:uncharacterized protein (DUF885 family)